MLKSQAQGYRLKVCTLALYCVCKILRQPFSRESYGSKTRSETTAEANCPAYFCLPPTAYRKGLESLASIKQLSFNEPFRLWLLVVDGEPHSNTIRNGEPSRRSVFIFSRSAPSTSAGITCCKSFCTILNSLTSFCLREGF